MSGIRRSVQVIDLLARKGAMGVRAVAAQLKLPLGSVHRLLLDLAEEAIVERNAAGEWELSFRLLEITGFQLDRLQLPQLARPFAERIAELTGETVNINALGNMGGVCVDKVRGSAGMHLDLRIGSRGPLYCGGAGKAMLAFMSDADQQRVFETPMVPLTDFTITDPDRLKAELGRIRKRGYAIDNQEVVMGVYCVSVPILDRIGRPAGAVSITGPTPKRAGPEIMPKVMMLSDACSQISRRLGFSGAWPIEAPLPERSAG